MICKCGAYVSGDFCTICERVIRDKPKLKTKISKRSEKGKADDLIYKALRTKYLRHHPNCEVFPELKATDIHHKKSRGKYYLDVSTFMAVSRQAHEKIHREHAWAVSMGYIESKLN